MILENPKALDCTGSWYETMRSLSWFCVFFLFSFFWWVQYSCLVSGTFRGTECSTLQRRQVWYGDKISLTSVSWENFGDIGVMHPCFVHQCEASAGPKSQHEHSLSIICMRKGHSMPPSSGKWLKTSSMTSSLFVVGLTRPRVLCSAFTMDQFFGRLHSPKHFTFLSICHLFTKVFFFLGMWLFIGHITGHKPCTDSLPLCQPIRLFPTPQTHQRYRKGRFVLHQHCAQTAASFSALDTPWHRTQHFINSRYQNIQFLWDFIKQQWHKDGCNFVSVCVKRGCSLHS